MSTRSDIIVNLANGKWHRIYCHWDGYIENNGAILQEYYNSQIRAEKLVKLGNLSSLGKYITQPAGFQYDDAEVDHCIYYGRDRGETDTAGFTASELIDAWPDKQTWTEYTYVWDSVFNGWLVGRPSAGVKGLEPLARALERQPEEETA